MRKFRQGDAPVIVYGKSGVKLYEFDKDRLIERKTAKVRQYAVVRMQTDVFFGGILPEFFRHFRFLDEKIAGFFAEEQIG